MDMRLQETARILCEFYRSPGRTPTENLLAEALRLALDEVIELRGIVEDIEGYRAVRRACPWCGQTFKPNRRDQKFCSKRCQLNFAQADGGGLSIGSVKMT